MTLLHLRSQFETNYLVIKYKNTEKLANKNTVSGSELEMT